MNEQMNDLIKQFAYQAGLAEILTEHASEYGTGDFEDTPYPELDAFAELIVRECIKQARKDENGPAYEAVARIARHFGVE